MKMNTPWSAVPSSSVVCDQMYEGINDGIEWITKRTAELLSETMTMTNASQPAEESSPPSSSSSPSRLQQDAVIKERAAVINTQRNGGVSLKRRRIETGMTNSLDISSSADGTTTESAISPPSTSGSEELHQKGVTHNNDACETITADNNKNRSQYCNRRHPHHQSMRRQQKQQRQRRLHRHGHHGCENRLKVFASDDDDDDIKVKNEQNEIGNLEDEAHNIDIFLRKSAWMYDNSSHPRRTTFCCSSGLDPIQEEEEPTINLHESRDDQEDISCRGFEKPSLEYLQKEPMDLDEDQYLNAYDNYSFQQRGIHPKLCRPASPSKQEVLMTVNDCKKEETNQFPFQGGCITPTNVADDLMSLWTT